VTTLVADLNHVKSWYHSGSHISECLCKALVFFRKMSDQESAITDDQEKIATAMLESFLQTTPEGLTCFKEALSMSDTDMQEVASFFDKMKGALAEHQATADKRRREALLQSAAVQALVQVLSYLEVSVPDKADSEKAKAFIDILGKDMNLEKLLKKQQAVEAEIQKQQQAGEEHIKACKAVRH